MSAHRNARTWIPSRRAGRSGAVARAMLVVILLIVACHPVRGCSESQFELATESRLPRWFMLPAGFTRADVRVSFSYYTSFGGGTRTATVRLRTGDGSTLQEVVATRRGREPLTLGRQEDAGSSYPVYEILTVNDVVEVMEHRRMEPVVYLTDEPEVKKELGVQE